MKIITIPDLHCKDIWRDIIETTDAEKYLFLGDYCDSFTHTNVEMLTNLEAIIDYKVNNPDKIELLLGNHEVSYLFGFLCSGYRAVIQNDVKALLETKTDNKPIFNFIYTHKNHYWSHAGISQLWWSNEFKEDIDIIIENSFVSIEDLIYWPDRVNELLWTKPNSLDIVSKASGGDSDYGSIVWQRITDWSYKAEEQKFLSYCTQIVGHTPVKSIEKKEIAGNTFYFTDCLDYKLDYLTLDL